MNIIKYRERKRIYAKTPTQVEYRRNYMRKWRIKNRDHSNQLARESHARHRSEINGRRKIFNIERYGITKDQLDAMIISQQGKCLICGIAPISITGKRALHIDHCHNTNRVRGLLCTRCNTHLGWHEKYYNEINNYLGKGEIE